MLLKLGKRHDTLIREPAAASGEREADALGVGGGSEQLKGGSLTCQRCPAPRTVYIQLQRQSEGGW